MTTVVEDFSAAAAAYVTTVEQVPADAWDRPGLGVWTVRDLVGHTSRSLITVEQYLAADVPDDAARLAGPAEYAAAARAGHGDPEAIAQRGRDAGAALGDDPAAAVRALADRVVPLVERTPLDTEVTTPMGVMALGAYLELRVFELVVHTLDLTRALGVDPAPGLPVRRTLRTISALVAKDPTKAAALIMATTGRAPLPEGFNAFGM